MVLIKRIFILSASVMLLATSAFARDIEYNNQEVIVRVNPGEPTQIKFPGIISGGFKRKNASLSLDKKNEDLIVFAQEAIPDQGEAIIVRLEDGRSFSLRVQRASAEFPRDDLIKLSDNRDSEIPTDEEEPAYREKTFQYAPATAVSGLVREMMLVAEFGKTSVSGYRPSDRYQGQVVLDDGAIKAVVEKMFLGSNLWGYVLDAENQLDVAQKINPATFRLDGTRAISADNWELAPRPLNTEQQIAGKHKAKIYIVTRSR
jgi:hypothetical protein